MNIFVYAQKCGRSNQMLMDSIDYTEDKSSKAQEVILEKQFDYFKEKNKAIVWDPNEYG